MTDKKYVDENALVLSCHSFVTRKKNLSWWRKIIDDYENAKGRSPLDMKNVSPRIRHLLKINGVTQ